MTATVSTSTSSTSHIRTVSHAARPYHFVIETTESMTNVSMVLPDGRTIQVDQVDQRWSRECVSAAMYALDYGPMDQLSARIQWSFQFSWLVGDVLRVARALAH